MGLRLLRVEGISPAWRQKLENRDYIANLASLAMKLARLKRANAT